MRPPGIPPRCALLEGSQSWDFGSHRHEAVGSSVVVVVGRTKKAWWSSKNKRGYGQGQGVSEDYTAKQELDISA